MFAHPGGDDAITEVYSVPDDARYLEPDLVRDQRALATAMVPDENPAREPAVRCDPRGRHPDTPYEVMRWRGRAGPARCAPRPRHQGTAPLNQTSR
ncbi:hypothetical protein OG333_30045 [Streptomyces anulatus]|uniref:hypothetical protein n=1 Tax=Streptomyces TaxID=1883 RepID=UPI001C54EEAB|nr:hypothetical protein [Streptomyces sp. or20]WSV78340.1 hypothetical protein OG333_30045 [Streptomyces anulatus]